MFQRREEWDLKCRGRQTWKLFVEWSKQGVRGAGEGGKVMKYQRDKRIRDLGSRWRMRMRVLQGKWKKTIIKGHGRRRQSLWSVESSVSSGRGRTWGDVFFMLIFYSDYHEEMRFASVTLDAEALDDIHVRFLLSASSERYFVWSYSQINCFCVFFFHSVRRGNMADLKELAEHSPGVPLLKKRTCVHIEAYVSECFCVYVWMWPETSPLLFQTILRSTSFEFLWSQRPREQWCRKK